MFNHLDLGGNVGGMSEMPRQNLSEKIKSSPTWLKAMADYFYMEAIKQRRRNSYFSDIRKMVNGDFVYKSSDINQTLYSTNEYANLTKDVPVPTHLKHFDFLGIMARAIKSMYSELDDLYRFESTDEYFTNEYLRELTNRYLDYGKKQMEAEINRYLVLAGLDPNKQDFKSEEEKQQYLQQLDAEAQKVNPDDIERDISKNFKVKAVEWANNVMEADKKKFSLDQEDAKALNDYILTGRWFRHYKIGHDYYEPEYWLPEEVFFSEELQLEYVQDADFVGRLTQMSLNKALQNYGNLMTTMEQEKVADFWGQKDNYKLGTNNGDFTRLGTAPFAEGHVVPFFNYYDHLTNLAMESVLNAPLAQTLHGDGTVERHFMPRANGSLFPTISDKNKRTDIVLRDDVVDVMEVYWVSQKKMGCLIYRNELGLIDNKTVTEDLISDFIKENDIKTKKNVSLSELQKAMQKGNLEDYENTITYFLQPEVRHLVVIKALNSISIKDDIILDGKPIIQQIKGDSNIYKVRIPVGGYIGNSPIVKAFPDQQLHNICMNQITELLSDEPGIFYSIDMNALPTEYKNQTTEEGLFQVLNTIKLTKMLPLNPGLQNTEGSTVYPNIFQRNEVVFKDQILYRRDLANDFKRQGMERVGITEQMLGNPNNYETAEGIKTQANASFLLVSEILNTFNTSKAKANEIHVAIAQMCETNGISNQKMMKNSDSSISFINILAEDPDYFPFRRINVFPASNQRDRKMVKEMQERILGDNTIMKEIEDVIDIMTNPYVLELKQIGKDITRRNNKRQDEQRKFEDEQNTKQLEAQAKDKAETRKHEIELTNLKGEWAYKEAYLIALGRDSSSTATDDFDKLQKAYRDEMDTTIAQTNIALKDREIGIKERMSEDKAKIEIEKIKQKNKELELRNKKIETDKFTSMINKN